MSWIGRWWAGTLLVVLCGASARAIELDSAKVAAMAMAQSPAVRHAKARLEAARRTVGWVALSPHRTEIEVEAGPRIGFDGTVSGDASLAVVRSLELGGKAEGREGVAREEVVGAEAHVREAETRARVEALSVWAEWVGAAARARVLRDAVGLAQQLEETVQRRVTGGAATRFDLNSARLARARASVEASGADRLVVALAGEIALLTGLAESPDPPENMAVSELPPLAEVLQRATASRGLVQAADAAIGAARARVQLARAEGAGDIGIGGFAAYEEENVIAGLVLRFELPERARADREADVRQAEVTAAEAEAEATRQSLTRQLTRAWHLASAAGARAERLRTEIDPLFQETEALLALAISRGTATSIELLSMLRERRELALVRVEAEAEALATTTLILGALGPSQATPP